MSTRADLVARLNERPDHDEISRCWRKAIDERRRARPTRLGRTVSNMTMAGNRQRPQGHAEAVEGDRPAARSAAAVAGQRPPARDAVSADR